MFLRTFIPIWLGDSLTKKSQVKLLTKLCLVSDSTTSKSAPRGKGQRRVKLHSVPSITLALSTVSNSGESTNWQILFFVLFLFCLREYLRVTDKHVYCRLFVKIVSAALRNTITFGAVFLIFIENLEHFLDAVPESGNLGNRISWSKGFYQQYIFTKCFLELCKLPLLAGHIQLNVHTVQYICTVVHVIYIFYITVNLSFENRFFSRSLSWSTYCLSQ